MRLRLLSSDGSVSERTVAANSIRLGRDPACEFSLDPAAYPMVSGRHARLECGLGGCLLMPLSQTNQTLLNDKPVAGAVQVQVGDRIRLGLTGPTIEIVAIDAGNDPWETVPAVEQLDGTVLAGPQHLALLRGSAAAQRLPIGAGGIIGRAAGQADYVLNHPHVSRRHARLIVETERILLHDLGSANGTFVNGRRLMQQVTLNQGDRIDIGPFSLVLDGAALVGRSRADNIELVASDLKRVVKDRATGQPLTLLDGINLVVRPREFLCLLGPTGSGKTTLLAMLSGRTRPDEGAVTINGEDLHAHFEALKQDIAVVPQKDVLHDALAVSTALGFTAELRLPPDTGREEIATTIADILEVVGLTKRSGTLIRHLSGGQVKRASLANELMARPTLLFLDEVTSGLDEQTDRDMMELFRQVADAGKTVVCITHSLANVEATCHLVVILTEGGRLAFVGTPEEARTYFGIARLGDAYRKLAERPAADWQAKFRASPSYARYVHDRLPARRGSEPEQPTAPRAPDQRPLKPVRQAWTLTRRYLAVWRGDYPALLAMVGQSVLVALLLGVLFGNVETAANSGLWVNLLFQLAVVSFWFGCNNAAKEIVKERTIYTRERDFNVRVDSYYCSKFLLLFCFSGVQVLVLAIIVNAWCHPPASFAAQGGLLLCLAAAGVALGLAISAVAPTEEMAITLIPMAIIPQILLAGVIAPLSGLSKQLAQWLSTVYWGNRGLSALLPQDKLSQVGVEQGSVVESVPVVLLHTLIFVLFAIAVLYWQGWRGGLGKLLRRAKATHRRSSGA